MFVGLQNDAHGSGDISPHARPLTLPLIQSHGGPKICPESVDIGGV